jgi:hypothetical protein
VATSTYKNERFVKCKFRNLALDYVGSQTDSFLPRIPSRKLTENSLKADGVLPHSDTTSCHIGQLVHRYNEKDKRQEHNSP